MYKRAIPYFVAVGAVFLLSIFLLDRIFLSPGLTGDGPFYVELHTTEDAPLFLRLDTATTSPLYLNLDMDTATSSPLYVQPPETISVKVFNADYLEPFAIYATFDTAQRNTRLAARSRREGRVQYVNDVNVLFLQKSARTLWPRHARLARGRTFYRALTPSASFSTSITDNRFSTGTRWSLSLSRHTGRPCPFIFFYRLPQVRSVGRFIYRPAAGTLPYRVVAVVPTL